VDVGIQSARVCGVPTSTCGVEQPERSLGGSRTEFAGGWVDGWMDGWMGVRPTCSSVPALPVKPVHKLVPKVWSDDGSKLSKYRKTMELCGERMSTRSSRVPTPQVRATAPHAPCATRHPAVCSASLPRAAGWLGESVQLPCGSAGAAGTAGH
jgi:hypothetical protein